MDLAIVISIGAFVILGVMFALLRASSRYDERNDSVTQEIIIRANTGPVHVHAPIITQEEEN